MIQRFHERRAAGSVQAPDFERVPKQPRTEQIVQPEQMTTVDTRLGAIPDARIRSQIVRFGYFGEGIDGDSFFCSKWPSRSVER